MRIKFNNKYSLAASVALLTFLVYLPALRNEFVYWDDNLYIFENPDIRSLDLAFFRWAFFGFHVSNWHPLTWISHGLDYAVWGMNPLGHHLTSIILHAINTALVVLLALKLLDIVREKSEEKTSGSFLNNRTIMIAAAVTGLLFGIHPVHVESVAWVSERKDLLCALFFLLSIMMYVNAVRCREHSAEGRGQSGESKGLTLCAMRYALFFFTLALLSKPMAVTLPVVLLILDWYPFRRIRSWKTMWLAGVEKLPLIALSAASAVITMAAQAAGEALLPLEQISLSVRVMVAAKSLVAYLSKMLLPLNLIPFYPYPKVVPLFSLEYLLAIGLVIGITAACAILARRQKLWLSAWGYYVVTLIPVLGIVQVGNQSMADRYAYLPSLGPFLVAGLGAAWVAEKVFLKQDARMVKITSGAVASLILLFSAYLTFGQTHIWHDSITLWNYVIEKSPEKISLAYSQRGSVFGQKGQIDKAIADLEMAIALNPDNYDAYMNLAVAFEKTGRIDKAKESMEKAVRVKPSSHEAYLYRGALYEETGQFEKAIADYTKAIALDPTSFAAYNDRGVAFGKTGQFEKAIADYSETIRINPRYLDAFSNRGVAYTLTGQHDKALEDFNAAIALEPNDPTTYYNRGSFYRRTGRSDLAFVDYQKSCGLGDERACGILHQLKQGLLPR